MSHPSWPQQPDQHRQPAPPHQAWTTPPDQQNRQQPPPAQMPEAPRAMGPAVGGIDRIAIRQKIALTINRFEIRMLDAGGNEGPLLALAEQKRLAMKEQITFWADEQRSRVAFSMKARQIMDIAPTFDVLDGEGRPLGWFKKEFGKSFLRSTWSAQDAQGLQISGTERSQLIAILRRLMNDSYLLNTWYHFDFTTADGQPVMHHTRAGGLRDRYAVDLPVFYGSHRLDWRFAAALGVALDVIQKR